MEYLDDLQRVVSLPTPPRRIVSLVPSITETLFALGAGPRVVGVTEYCTHPPDGVATITKVGGTKNPRLDVIRQLDPDLVIVNEEENRREDYQWLEAQGLTLYVTAPRTVADGIRLIDQLGRVLGCQEAGEALSRRLRALSQRIEQETARQPRVRVFCPIWRKPWMGFNRHTYVDDMVWRCGGENVLRERADRYFTVTLEEVAALAPQVVVLPSEPYPFTSKHFVHLKPLADTPAGRAGHFYCVDGMALCWYGPRIADGLTELSRLFAYVRSTVE